MKCPRASSSLVMLTAVLCVACGALSADDLAEQFRTPPDSAKPHTWWHWMDGNVTKEGITADLEAMKEVGMGGAQMFHVSQNIPPGPVGYMSPQWLEMMQHAIKEAGRVGLELCLHNCAGWSSSGGPWIKPEHAMQVIAWSEKAVHGPAAISEVLPPLKPPKVHKAIPFARDIAVLAYPVPAGGAAMIQADRFLEATAVDPVGSANIDISPTSETQCIRKNSLVLLTDKMDASGKLTWNVPPGDWVILRIGHTPTGKNNHPAPPEGDGLEVDKLSREALDEHWNGMMAKVIAQAGPLAGKVLNNALIDSYEVGSQNWTPKFAYEFRKRRGYDPLPYLAVVTGRLIDSREETRRFLWDFRRTIADLYADNYFGYFGELCHKHGMQFSTEPYGNGTFDYLQCGGRSDIPMGEFWIGGAAMETTKLASSIAHTYGRKFVGAESFTADDKRGRWLVEPYGIKAIGDLVFCNGINRYIFHRYAHQPWMEFLPGMTMGPWGTHLERTVTWWNEAATWLQYVARCQYLLQEGKFVADALYYSGEAPPNSLPPRQALRPEIPAGYDYDGCDAVVLLTKAEVRRNRIVLPDGMSYSVLVLPESKFMTPRVARKIRELVRAGATVVGPKPEESPSLSGYPTCDKEVREIAQEVWGDVDGRQKMEHDFGKGRVIHGKPLREVFSAMRLEPDFEASAKGSKVAYIHRRIREADVYFVSNQKYAVSDIECTFRIQGKRPELWHADTGKTEPAPAYREQGGRTIVPLRLDPAESVFVVFRTAGESNHLTNIGLVGILEAGNGETSAPHVTVRKARYEAPDGRGKDVTDRVVQLVADGQYEIPATNDMFNDPVPLVVKQLRVDYEVDGKPASKTVREGETLTLLQEARSAPRFPLCTVSRDAEGRDTFIPWHNEAVFMSVWADGKGQHIESKDSVHTLEVPGPWTLKFRPGLGAPPEITLDKLMSWPDHATTGVRYYSGSVDYETELELPADAVGGDRKVMLDFGRVKNFATVRVNGKDLGVLWKEPFRVDATQAAVAGRNRLEVKVTNLWPNRLIGDEQLEPDVEWAGDHLKQWPDWYVQKKTRPSDRITFTTWHFYKKDSPLLESGLLGPVTVRSSKPIVLVPNPISSPRESP